MLVHENVSDLCTYRLRKLFTVYPVGLVWLIVNLTLFKVQLILLVNFATQSTFPDWYYANSSC